jgi:FixJ family two-component response regulator
VNGSVLLVEDDDDARELLCRALERARYECTPARDAAEALAHARARGYFDVVVTDIVLGSDDRGGLSLMSALRGMNIAAPIVLITAFADLPKLKQALNQGAAHLLEKPFRAAELLRVVAEVLQPVRDTSHATERVLRSADLTDKELAVARHLLDGLSSTEIAQMESNSAKTIRQHVSRIYAKFGVSSRADFFRLVYSGGGAPAR